ncbi:hypothetical protein MRB53_006259 [Persea americana]|uniref:Uncharacterized protein n=1 Tax=Persea americana TaxID=3435 RepID=A0ACC2MGM7_PERAE|nr:hypothetical protein MRB53_006259 [Persea americana]
MAPLVELRMRLLQVKDDFNNATSIANSLNKEFGSKLKEHMQYCVDHPEEISKLAKVKAKVSEVKRIDDGKY